MATSRLDASGVRVHRDRLGWSQAELARRAGLSRSEISAIETGRVQPSVGAALALGGALGRSVEELFGPPPGKEVADWAWAPPVGDASGPRYWLADLGGRRRRFPVEPTPLGTLAHDGREPGGSNGGLPPRGPGSGRGARRAHGVVEGGALPDPTRTLVVAGCDPAAAVLAGRLGSDAGVRLLPYARGSRRALEMLAEGRVHAAGLHLSGDPEGNAARVREHLGPGYRLVHVARWVEGLVLAPGLGLGSASPGALRRLRWVGREEGSGARQCLDALFEGRPPPDGLERVARDHRGVAETVRTGWAQAGVCVRLVAEEAGLDFMPVREEAYDLCFPADLVDDARIAALVDTIRSRAFRRVVGELPGYDTRDAGAVT